ncbi:MAG: HDOD domain-containing protein [Burkholderiales bacterium]
MPLLTTALRDLNAWAAYFRDTPIPVLSTTVHEIHALAELEEARSCVDAQMLAQAIGNDPLMTMRLLAHAGRHRTSRQITDAETVTAAIMMMGIGPFFREFGNLPPAEAALADLPEAREGLARVVMRAHRAAHFALGFAVHRMDGDAAVIQEAALLHDFAEMLLWCHAPALALEIQRRQHEEPALRSADAQRAVLNIDLPALEQALMRAWHLPELLLQITDDAHTHALVAPQRRTVQLAVRLARHSARGWDNTALPDDLSDIAEFLNLSVKATERLLHQLND